VWKVIIKAIFSQAIDGDLRKLVHLSNILRMLFSAEASKEGSVAETKA